MNPHQKPQEDVVGHFWLIVHEPGMVPERKGSWPATDTAKVLREFIKARPTAYLHVLTIGADGSPYVDHGPEVLQMLDGRSMGVGRKHNARTSAAHAAALAYEAGRRDMREAAGKVAQDEADDIERHQPSARDSWQQGRAAMAKSIAASIRNLPTEPLGGEAPQDNSGQE